MLNDDKLNEELEAFDDVFPDGIYVIPSSGPKIKVRALLDYCNEKGIKPEDLEPEELEKFLVY